MSESAALRSWQKLAGSGVGRWIFSRAVCLRAPYFRSIRPLFERLEHGYAAARFRKRRSVTNHIGTVHAIAMANLCELVAGTLTEVSIPRSMRWIPRGMSVSYLARAETDVRAEATFPQVVEGEPQDVVVPVDVFDANGERVVHAAITMYVTPRRVS
jgi:acyl-coenzyme A thioesterase PaaI-like protein